MSTAKKRKRENETPTVAEGLYPTLESGEELLSREEEIELFYRVLSM